MESSCFCGLIPAKTGVLVFLVIHAIFAAVGIYFFRFGLIGIIIMIFLLLHCVGIYGALQEKAGFLVPFLIYLGICAEALICLMLLTAALAIFFLNYIVPFIQSISIPGMNGTDANEMKNFTANMKLTESLDLIKGLKEITTAKVLTVLLIVEAIYLVIVALIVHSIVVVWTFIKEAAKLEGRDEED